MTNATYKIPSLDIREALNEKNTVPLKAWLEELAGNDTLFADLSEWDLSGLDLWGVNLHGAKLRDANLSKANLKDAILHHADLTGADLSNIRINSGTDFDDTTIVHGAIVSDKDRNELAGYIRQMTSAVIYDLYDSSAMAGSW
jgi:uncharacterized protein YjbI with pentapeptide repeats